MTGFTETTPIKRSRPELVDLRTRLHRDATVGHHARFGVRGSVAMRRLANPVTFREGHGIFFVAASKQIQMVAYTGATGTRLRP
jgi:hypothetical protein